MVGGGFWKSVNIEEIVIYNRTDSHAQRLDGFTLKVLSLRTESCL